MHFLLLQSSTERWVSGWNQQFAKLPYWATGTGGSNPPLSAKKVVKKVLVLLKKSFTFAPLYTSKSSGYGPVRLRRLLWEQEIVSSNLTTPTDQKAQHNVLSFFCLRASNLFECEVNEKRTIRTKWGWAFWFDPSPNMIAQQSYELDDCWCSIFHYRWKSSIRTKWGWAFWFDPSPNKIAQQSYELDDCQLSIDNVQIDLTK